VNGDDQMSTALRPAFAALRRAARDEQRAEAQAAYEVGYEKGFLAGYETAERDRPASHLHAEEATE
jgi:hypothetical protein